MSIYYTQLQTSKLNNTNGGENGDEEPDESLFVFQTQIQKKYQFVAEDPIVKSDSKDQIVKSNEEDLIEESNEKDPIAESNEAPKLLTKMFESDSIVQSQRALETNDSSPASLDESALIVEETDISESTMSDSDESENDLLNENLDVLDRLV